MVAVTESYPGTAITANQKTDVQSVPAGADDNWWAAADGNKLLQFAVAFARANRAGANLPAITGAAEALTFPKIVKFTGAASGGLPVVTAVLTADVDKQSAVGVAVLAQGGSTVSAAAATAIFLARECVLTGTWSAGSYYYPDASGDFSTVAIDSMNPVGYAISTTLLYFNAQGVKSRQTFGAGNVTMATVTQVLGTNILAIVSSAADMEIRHSAAVLRIKSDTTNPTLLIERDGAVTIGKRINLPAITPTTNAGDIYNDSGQTKHGSYTNGLAGWFERCIWSGYAAVTHSGIVTGQSLFTGTAKGTRTLPANFWKQGKALRIRLQGNYTTDAAPGNATIDVKFGSTTYRTTGSFALDGNVTNGFWALEFAVVCETTGAAGTLNGNVSWQHTQVTGGTTPMHARASTTIGPVTIDTTASMAVDVQWTADDAGTSITCQTARIWEVC